MAETKLANLIGRRVRFIHTEDRNSKLNYGDLGTLENISIIHGEIKVWVKWDKALGLLLVGPRDVFDFI